MKPANSQDRLEGRNGAIWKAYVSGATQEAIAAEHGISQAQVSRVLSEVRESIPPTERATAVLRELDFVDQMRRAALDVFDLPPKPAYSNGRMMVDENGLPIPDHSARLAAFDRAMKAHERLSKLLGLDAAAKSEVSVTVDPDDIEVVQRIKAWKAAQETPDDADGVAT